MIFFDHILVDVVTLSIAAVTFAYIYFTWTFDYWQKRKVIFEKPTVFFGNFKDVFYSRTTVGELMTDLYKKYKGEPFVGFWRFRTPCLLIRDLELVKTVLLKDFNKFEENGMRIDPHLDPLVGKNPFFQKGSQWKTTRSLLTPNFTNAKLKPLFPLMEEVCADMVAYLNEKADSFGPEGLEAKDFTSKFTMENVATCAFGIRADSFKDPNAELRRHTKQVLEPGLLKNIEFMLMNFAPFLGSLLKIRLTPKEVDTFFRKTVEEVVSHREKNNIVRSDYLQHLILMKNKAIQNKEDFSNEDVTGHAVTFLTEGFETSSITLSFALHELACNPQAQETLRAEVDAAAHANGGKLSFETIMEELPFLQHVMDETLRMHPPLMQMEKVCTHATTLSAGGRQVHLEPGMLVVVPVRGLHMDGAFFDDPHRFDPDRFAPPRRDAAPKFAFLPFGEGPRLCLGMRFAQAQVKLALATLVRHFEVRRTPKTPDPVVQDPYYFLHGAKGGLWVNFVKRQHVH